MEKLIYNVGFINSKGQCSETQYDIIDTTHEEAMAELVNLILSHREEMNIKKITYIELDHVEDDEDE